jgi:ferrous iron transport protein B
MADNKNINIVLAGQGNAGKSVVFNYLTGLHQHIGNWAGKTIEKKEGTLYYKGYTIDILDLPGIYSLNTYSEEEVISREYIVHQKPEFVINIIDAVNLERNLMFTLQLLELECPVILVLNMMDLARKKGISITLTNSVIYLIHQLFRQLHCVAPG